VEPNHIYAYIWQNWVWPEFITESHGIYLDQTDLSGSEFHHCSKKVFLHAESAIVHQVLLILTLLPPFADLKPLPLHGVLCSPLCKILTQELCIIPSHRLSARLLSIISIHYNFLMCLFCYNLFLLHLQINTRIAVLITSHTMPFWERLLGVLHSPLTLISHSFQSSLLFATWILRLKLTPLFMIFLLQPHKPDTYFSLSTLLIPCSWFLGSSFRFLWQCLQSSNHLCLHICYTITISSDPLLLKSTMGYMKTRITSNFAICLVGHGQQTTCKWWWKQKELDSQNYYTQACHTSVLSSSDMMCIEALWLHDTQFIHRRTLLSS
jgi:hypothetical protein